jgi:hypothetical protein
MPPAAIVGGVLPANSATLAGNEALERPSTPGADRLTPHKG